MRSRRRAGRLCTMMAASMVAACSGESVVRAPPPVGAPSQAKDVPQKRRVSEPLVLRVTLEDPRFAAVNDRLRAHDAPGAAHAFEEARPAVIAGAGADATCAIDYVAGRLHRDAGEDSEAAAAFDRVPADCPLAPYASLQAAQADARSGKGDDSIARARRVPADVPIAADARLCEAEVLAARGDRAAALVSWRAHLSASPHGVRWVDTAVKVATADLDGVDGDPSARAREALDLTTRVIVEAPKLADVSGAQAARDRAVALLHAADPAVDGALSTADHVRRAQALLDGNDATRALAEVAPLITLPPGGDACKAAIVRAQATAKLRGATADAWGDAIGRCAGDDALVTALFSGAKASFSAKRADEALARYAQVEALFPKHRLADDARFRAAMIAQQAGDEAHAESLFTSLVEDYPEGDMRSEALFRLSLARMTRGDWEGAKETLERSAAAEPGDPHALNAGRAAYFRARAAGMTGDTEGAATRYEALIASLPLGYAMVQAYVRLTAIDPDRARRAVDAAVAREGETLAGVTTRDHEELHSAGFGRAQALLEVGETDSARRELGRLVGDTTDPEVIWVIASLYERVGANDVAQSSLGPRVNEYLAHWPAGPWRARWEVAYPRPFGDVVERASATSKIPAALTWAIMRQESAFVVDARSPSDAYGLMQIIVPTARGLVRGTGFGADPDSLARPEVSISLGAKLLGQLRASYPDNRALAIAAYNGGGGAVGRWLAARGREDFDLWVEEIPFDETRGYMKRVLANEAAYAFLYAPASLDEVLALPTRVTR